MRFLQMAVFAPKRVYLLTCTALQTQFAKDEAEFRASLKSFRLPK